MAAWRIATWPRGTARRLGLAALLVAACIAAGCHPARLPAAAPPAEGPGSEAAREANAERWNATFERAPGAGYGWSGGDAAISLTLPFCAECPPGSRYRRLWLFGDSAFSSVDAAGRRVNAAGARGADYRFGNVAAITAHATPSAPAAKGVAFDYGARGVRSNAWMPLLLDPRALPDMDDLRIAAAGYASLGFARTPAPVAGVYSLPGLAPAALRPELVPVQEYYAPASRASDYDTREPATRAASAPGGADAYRYQRVAFYVFRSPQAGTVGLYRHRAAAHGDVVLTLAAAAGGSPAGVLLGYVYPPGAAPPDVHALVEYSRAAPDRPGRQHVYTTRPNDDGKDVLMWPNRGLVIGADLVQVFSPVTPLDLPGMVPWDDVDRNIVAIVRGVDRPYARWGKRPLGDWELPPAQFALLHSDARTNWGHFLLKDRDFARNGFVYVYGRRAGALVVARVACRDADDFVRFGNWRFYSDGAWVAAPEAATPIAGYAAADFSIHESPSGRLVLIQSPPGLAPAIDLAVAASPTGPFRPGKRIALATRPGEADRHARYSYYAVSAHEGLSVGDGVLISYVRSCAFSAHAACRGPDSDDHRADVYVPRFVDLPWRAIDP